jgi:hypothetical protein
MRTVVNKITIYAPMICSMTYTASCIMFWMRAYPLLGQVGEGWALGFESFLGPVKWHRADRRVPFGAQKIYYVLSKSLLTKTLTMICFGNP